MSLGSRLVVGIVASSFIPFMSTYAAGGHGGAVANSQFHPQQPAVTQSTAQSAEQPTTTPQPDVATKPNTGKFKDQSAAPAFSWAGIYMGAYVGGAWGNSRLNTNAGNVTPVTYFTSTARIGSVNQNGTGTVLPRNVVGGIQVGNNVQSDSLIYGAVLDFGSFRLSQSKNAANINYPGSASQYSLSTSMSTSWLASLRARVGWAASNEMPFLYATGGVGITNLHVANNFSDNTASLAVGGASSTQVKAGWIVGAGVEMPVYGNWTVDGDYQFVNFGSYTANGFIVCRTACAGHRSPFSTAANLSASMVRFSLNYKF